MTSVMFGPYCTVTLANLGAEVIKLETPAGDELRRVGKPRVNRRMGPAHLTMNRGKMSIAWDIKSEAGRRDFRALLAQCDVLIHNLCADAVTRAALDYDSVRAIRPDIIYVHCTGFGSDGPYAGRPAYDDVIQALSGAASLIPRVAGGGAPRFIPTALADKVSGLHAAYAVLAALYHREWTGKGQAIEVPMFEATTHFLLQEPLYGQTFDPPHEPAGYPRQLDPDRQPMATRDGYVVIVPYTDERWQRFFALVGRGDILEDERFAPPIGRLTNLAVLQHAMAEIVAMEDTAYWLHLMAEGDIPVARCNELDDLLGDRHLKEIGFFERLTHPTEGAHTGLKPPVRFSINGTPELRHAPLSGANSLAVRGIAGIMDDNSNRDAPAKK